MSKKFHCAECGKELKIIQKTIPYKGIVMNLVEPHVCEEGEELDERELEGMKTPAGAFKILDGDRVKGLDKKIDELFNDFPFVQKLNKATAEHEVVTQEAGDKRDKKDLRQELVISTAPLSALEMARRSKG